jgi:hypothetical protein
LLVAYRLSIAVCTVAVALVGFSLAGPGCSAQGEGDRCTFFPNQQNNNAVNGTDECQNGLICYSGQQFADYSQGFTFDRCCPPVLNPQDAVEACQSSSNVTGGNPTAGADASFGSDTSTTDATPQAADGASDAADAQADAGADSADAGVDAAADTGADSSG